MNDDCEKKDEDGWCIMGDKCKCQKDFNEVLWSFEEDV